MMSKTKRIAGAVLLGVLILTGLLFWGPGRLWPSSRALRIQVVDPDGRPVAGIPVGLLLDRERSPEAWKNVLLTWQGVTAGDEGLVDVRFLPRKPPALYGLGEGEIPAGPAEVFLFLGMIGAPAVKVDLSSPPAESIRLQLPPTGRVRVRVAMEGGTPVAEDVAVLLMTRSTAKEDRAVFWGRSGMADGRWSPNEKEDFVFDHVGLGLDLIVKTHKGMPPALAEGAGPSVAGETVEFSLTLPAYPVLTGRLLDEKGTPAREHEFFYICQGDGWRLRRPVQLDAGGTFRFPMEPRFVGAREVRLVVTDDPDFSMDKTKYYATAELTGPLAGGEVPVGDLVLKASLEPDWPWKKPLVAGRVKDQEGRPLEGIEVLVSRRFFLFDASRKSLGVTEWNDRYPWRARSGPVGDFLFIPEWTEADRYRLQAVSGEMDCSPLVEAALGARDLELVLGPGGAIEGAVFLDLGLPPEVLNVRLVPSGGKRSVEALLGEVGDDGRFRFNRVPAGTSDLEVRLRDELLASIEGIEVPAGEASRDPRLKRIDLKGRLRSIEVTLAAPSRWDRFFTTVRGKEHASFDEHFSGEPFNLILGRESVDLLLEADGFPPRLVRSLDGDLRIELDPGELVVLRLDPAVTLPGVAYSMEVSLDRGVAGEPEEEFRIYFSQVPFFFPVSHARFDRAGTARLRVPSTGEHELEVRLVFEGEGRIARRRIPVAPARVSAGRGEVQLRPEPEALARAIEELGRR